MMIGEVTVWATEVHPDNPAYRSGWEDGRFGPPETFVTNANLAVWTEYLDRLAYYRGHRDGRRVREMLGVDRKAI
jgi:hypothetical protein